MKKYLWIVVLFFLYSVKAQEECWDACSLPLDFCTFVNYPIYPTNVSANEAQTTATFSDPLFSVLRQDCQDTLKLFACSSLYSSCTNISGVAVKVKPCIDMCTNVHTVCKDYIPYFTADLIALINCSAIDTDGSPTFETNESACVNLTNITPLPCFESSDGIVNNNTNTNGNCFAYNVTLTPNTAELCAPYVSNEIFLPGTSATTQTLLDSEAAGNATLLLKLFPVLPIKCFTVLASLFCQSLFPSCVHVNATYDDSDPHCRSFCEGLSDVCGSIFELEGFSSLVSCDAIHPLTRQKLYPDTGCNTDIIPRNAHSSFSLPSFEKCPSVLARKENPSESESHCSYPCPDRTNTDHQIDTIVTVMFVLGSFSFVLLFFMLISQLISFEKRQFPVNLYIYMTVVLLCLIPALFINGSNPRENVWCKDAATYSNMSDNAACGVQAFLFTYGALAYNAWVLVSTSILVACVVFGQRVLAISKYQPFFHLFAWGFPAVFSIVTLALKKFGAVPGLPLCFIQFQEVSFTAKISDGMSIDWPLFFIPLGFLFFSSAILYAITFGKILYAKTKLVKSKEVYGGVDAIARAQQRVAMFTIVLIIFAFCLLQWRGQTEAGKSPADVVEWVYCKLCQEFDIPYNGTCPSDRPPALINYGHLMFVVVLAACLGMIQFILFGFDKNVYTNWILIYETIFNTHDYKYLKKVILYGTERAGPRSSNETGTPTDRVIELSKSDSSTI